MPGNRRASLRSRQPRQQQAEAPSECTVFADADLELFSAIRDGIGTPCNSKQAFLRMMLPAKGIAVLLPATEAFTSHPSWLLTYQNATGARTLKHLLAVLAWSSREVVPGHTPAGLDACDAARLWTLVAQRCAIALSSILPRAQRGGELLPEVLQSCEDTGMPGG